MYFSDAISNPDTQHRPSTTGTDVNALPDRGDAAILEEQPVSDSLEERTKEDVSEQARGIGDRLEDCGCSGDASTKPEQPKKTDPLKEENLEGKATSETLLPSNDTKTANQGGDGKLTEQPCQESGGRNTEQHSQETVIKEASPLSDTPPMEFQVTDDADTAADQNTRQITTDQTRTRGSPQSRTGVLPEDVSSMQALFFGVRRVIYDEHTLIIFSHKGLVEDISHSFVSF